MEFTLFYKGPVLSPGALRSGKIVSTAERVQGIRREFHKQLKELWGLPPLCRHHKDWIENDSSKLRQYDKHHRFVWWSRSSRLGRRWPLYRTVTNLVQGPDPRFATQASLQRSLTIITPAGLASTLTARAFPLSVPMFSHRLSGCARVLPAIGFRPPSWPPGNTPRRMVQTRRRE